MRQRPAEQQAHGATRSRDRAVNAKGPAAFSWLGERGGEQRERRRDQHRAKRPLAGSCDHARQRNAPLVGALVERAQAAGQVRGPAPCARTHHGTADVSDRTLSLAQGCYACARTER